MSTKRKISTRSQGQESDEGKSVKHRKIDEVLSGAETEEAPSTDLETTTSAQPDDQGDSNVDNDEASHEDEASHGDEEGHEEHEECEENDKNAEKDYLQDMDSLQRYIKKTCFNHVNVLDGLDMLDITFYKEGHFITARGQQGVFNMHVPVMRVSYPSTVDGQMQFPQTNFYQMKWSVVLNTSPINGKRNTEAHTFLDNLKKMTRKLVHLAILNPKTQKKLPIDLSDIEGDDAKIDAVLSSANTYLPYKPSKNDEDEFQITIKAPVWQYSEQKFNYKASNFNTRVEYKQKVAENTSENTTFGSELIEKHSAGNSRNKMYLNIPRVFDIVNEYRVPVCDISLNKDDLVSVQVQPKLIFGPKTFSVRLQQIFIYSYPGVHNDEQADVASSRYAMIGNL